MYIVWKDIGVFHDRDSLWIENISKELINSLPYVEFDLKKREYHKRDMKKGGGINLKKKRNEA